MELESSPPAIISGTKILRKTSSGLKLTCTVNGPRPLPRSAPYSPHLRLSTHVKFAPFATRERRGYVRHSSERDLGSHLETALRGVLISERWPKSGLDVVITILEGEEDRLDDDTREITRHQDGHTTGWGLMNILSGCITVASAAIADAGIDCVGLVTGGVAAVVRNAIREPMLQFPHTSSKAGFIDAPTAIVLDPRPSEHREILSACVVGYLKSRDEITEIWAKSGNSERSSTRQAEQPGFELLVDHAMEAASSTMLVLEEALNESTALKVGRSQVG